MSAAAVTGRGPRAPGCTRAPRHTTTSPHTHPAASGPRGGRRGPGRPAAPGLRPPACGPARPGPAATLPPAPSARVLPVRLSRGTEADLSRYAASPAPRPSLPRGLPPAWPSRAPGTCRAASPRTAARAPPAAPGPAVPGPGPGPGPAGLTGSFPVPGSLLGTPVPKRLPGAKMLPDLFRPAETWPGLAGQAGLELPAGRLFPGPRSGCRRPQPGAHDHPTGHTPRPPKISQRDLLGGAMCH
jgi:translation initiation factor IF-2